MRFMLPLLATLLALPLAAQAPKSTLAGLAFLKGRWEAEPDTTGAKGTFSLEEALGGTVLMRRNVLAFPPKEGRPGATHEDLLVVAPEDGVLKATYWDNESHVIRYTVATEPGRATFTSTGPGPRFRLTYLSLPQDRLEVSFDIAAPNTPEAFKPYLKGFAKRIK